MQVNVPHLNPTRQAGTWFNYPVYHTRIPYTDHVANATVRFRAGSPPQPSQLIQRKQFWLFGHVARMDALLDISRALKTSIRGLPIDWKRPPRRPRHTWLRTLGAVLQPHNLGLNSAWKYAQDRKHWKHLVETATLQLWAHAWWWWWWRDERLSRKFDILLLRQQAIVAVLVVAVLACIMEWLCALAVNGEEWAGWVGEHWMCVRYCCTVCMLFRMGRC